MNAQAEQDAVAAAVIDDHDAIRLAVQTWCRQADPPILVSDYSSATDFLADEPRPGLLVVVFDVMISEHRPDFGALATMFALGHRVIVYSHRGDDEVILRCLDLGAVSVVMKSEGKAHLCDAVHAAAAHEPYVAPQMGKAMFRDKSVGRAKLTPRETEVLIAWIQTESKDVVAQQLAISVTTVATHLKRVRAKYAAAGRPALTKSALVARAIQDGIICLEEL